MELLRDAMEKGGLFMWPILACLVFGFAIGLERLFTLFLRLSIHAPVFMAAVQRMVLDDDLDGAIRLCNAEAGAVLPRVVKAGLLRYGQPDDEIRDGMEEAALEVYPIVSRRMGYLPMIANVSTLLGLLGTIQGLIVAFHAVEQSSSEARSTALAQGIAVAMYTTFFGLVVSVPILVVHSLAAARANQLLDEIDHHMMKVLNLLRAVAPAPTGAPVIPLRG